MTETTFHHLRLRREQDVLVLTLTVLQVEGEEIAQAIYKEIQAAVESPHIRKVVLNLEQIRYISSVALRPFLLLRRVLLERHGQLLLCGLSRQVGDVLYTTRLVSNAGEFTAPFEMVADVPTAIARLTNPPTVPSGPDTLRAES
jgi:anti-anti-sigma factor